MNYGLLNPRFVFVHSDQICCLRYLIMLLQIVRPGGMERPTDAYKETHNITLSEEDTLFGGQVSNLQVLQSHGS